VPCSLSSGSSFFGVFAFRLSVQPVAFSHGRPWWSVLLRWRWQRLPHGSRLSMARIDLGLEARRPAIRDIVPRQNCELLVYGRDGEITSRYARDDGPRPAKK
jgi:hypothetical protein